MEFFTENKAAFAACIPALILLIDVVVRWTKTEKDNKIWDRLKQALPLFRSQPGEKVANKDA